MLVTAANHIQLKLFYHANHSCSRENLEPASPIRQTNLRIQWNTIPHPQSKKKKKKKKEEERKKKRKAHKIRNETPKHGHFILIYLKNRNKED